VRPDGSHVAAVLSAFVNAGDVENANALFRHYFQAKGIQPTVACFNALVKACGKPNYSDGANKAEAILRAMKAEHSVDPDLNSYMACLMCWYKSGRTEAFQRAKALVEEMIEQARSGNDAVAPNDKAFQVLVSTLLRVSAVKDGTIDVKHEADHVEAMMNKIGLTPTKSVLCALQKCQQGAAQRRAE
jgi:hypothetical protein